MNLYFILGYFIGGACGIAFAAVLLDYHYKRIDRRHREAMVARFNTACEEFDRRTLAQFDAICEEMKQGE